MHGERRTPTAGPAERQKATSGPATRTRVERGIVKRMTATGATRYEYAFVDSDGKLKRGTARTLREARLLRGERMAKADKGEVAQPKRTTFADFSEVWYESKSTRVRGRTADYHRRALDLVLLPRFGRLQLRAVDADAIAKLTRDLEREGLHALDPARPIRALGPSSIANYLKPARGVMQLAARRRLIPVDPFDLLVAEDRPARRDVEPPHEWSPEEVSALLAASTTIAARPESRYDYSPLLRLTAVLGLRISEALGLRWEDFEKDEDDGAGVLHVRRQWLPSREYGPTKTRAGVRRIPLPPVLRDELIALQLRSAFSQAEHPIFASQVGGPLGHRNVTGRGFEPARDLAGLPGSVTFHDLRHAAASRLINAGLDPVAVAGVLGHEDATTTLRVYAHLFDRRRTGDAVREALAGGQEQPAAAGAPS
jgi:integrase